MHVKKLTIFVLVFFMLFLRFPKHYSLTSNEQINTNIEKIKKDQENIDEILLNSKLDQAIFNREIERRKNNGEKITTKLLFSRSAIVGDSMARALIAYGAFNAENVFAQVSKRLDNSDELFQKAIDFHPQNLFIQFGLNDISYYNGASAPFIATYESIILNLQEKLPTTHLFVIGMHPMREDAYINYPEMRYYKDYNEAMKDMCERMNITFVSVESLIHPTTTYEYDGEHPQEPYYTEWANLMVEYLR